MSVTTTATVPSRPEHGPVECGDLNTWGRNSLDSVGRRRKSYGQAETVPMRCSGRVGWVTVHYSNVHADPFAVAGGSSSAETPAQVTFSAKDEASKRRSSSLARAAAYLSNVPTLLSTTSGTSAVITAQRLKGEEGAEAGNAAAAGKYADGSTPARAPALPRISSVAWTISVDSDGGGATLRVLPTPKPRSRPTAQSFMPRAAGSSECGVKDTCALHDGARASSADLAPAPFPSIAGTLTGLAITASERIVGRATQALSHTNEREGSGPPRSAHIRKESHVVTQNPQHSKYTRPVTDHEPRRHTTGGRDGKTLVGLMTEVTGVGENGLVV
ncbi:hypothetical protein N7499_003238 [Penicillium canescens]|uniref:Uncharacterized protein n=1 Tax=Penicillium canescens TaxID=5083 RepID=A0AAD6I5J9_PENCN|nr:uncharacterized protein N7446_014183 [Penicillium canescens]KAJ6018557.1 hypothetical protein N7522_002021 [Penicillium canescens]KAJ6034167.1 hypothetical protein N7460_009984 [Penicillium canescens]KAJ6038903.1 hypothetical protein N7446_014183 [Penicillium canescens]KAJ6066111.1 hypothetical protein N7444_000240 [Penicillium canescens]KAJ6091087.1 hypothetical protein N7499_003238 [Penicillium canescens]